MGEDKQEGEKKEESKEEMKAEEQTEIVLKVDMHCEACARKVARALKGFQGVEDVVTDSKANRVVVKGKSADPIKVYERLQKKSGRKIEIISPLPTPPVPDGGNEEAKEEDKQLEQKEEPPAVVTVVLKVQMHCEACAQVLRKRIRKIKGVESVETDLSKNEVAVKGVVDPTMLVEYVLKRTGKHASVVKEEEKEEEEKKEEKEKEKPAENKTEEEAKEEEEKKSDDIKKSEYWPSNYYSEYAYAYPPQIFSDENPNACSVM